jgi:hypothetical protein
MDKFHSRSRERWEIPVPPRHSEDRIQYLLKAEEQILRSITTRAPLPGILNEICSALDCQIGNMVSLISLAEDDATSAADIGRNAALFGLYIFFSAGIVAESGEELGSLELYCCVPRNPSPREFQLIERAACLAALAIDRDMEAGHYANCRIPENRPVRGNALKWPVCMN